MTLTRRQFTGGLVAVGAAAGLPGCVATNPATGRSSFTGLYSIEDDIAIGREARPGLVKSYGGEYSHPQWQAYVRELGQYLAKGTEYPDLPYDVILLNTPIVNAFALPGGNLFITRGLIALASNEAELAGVLSHELSHVNARHTAERMSQGMLAQVAVLLLGVATNNEAITNLASYGAQAYIQSYSRDQEFEADTLGVRYMARAGFDPDAMVTFLSSLRDHSMVEAEMMGLPAGQVDEFNMMASHPRTVERVEAAMQAAAAQRPARPRVGRDEYMARLNGILYGDDPEQGMAFATRFVHPGLRFEFTVPDGFRLFNEPDRVVAQGPDKAAIVFDMGKQEKTRSLSDYLQHEWATKLALRAVDRLSVNGLEAATGVTTAQGSSGTVDVRALAIRGDGQGVFRFLFITPPGKTAALSEGLRRTTYSFRRLSRDEAAKVRPNTLITVPIRRGDSVEALARPMPFGTFNEAVFRVLNDLKPSQPLPDSGMVKVVVH